MLRPFGHEHLGPFNEQVGPRLRRQRDGPIVIPHGRQTLVQLHQGPRAENQTVDMFWLPGQKPIQARSRRQRPAPVQEQSRPKQVDDGKPRVQDRSLLEVGVGRFVFDVFASQFAPPQIKVGAGVLRDVLGQVLDLQQQIGMRMRRGRPTQGHQDAYSDPGQGRGEEKAAAAKRLSSLLHKP
jgi:hypothetical protein